MHGCIQSYQCAASWIVQATVTPGNTYFQENQFTPQKSRANIYQHFRCALVPLHSDPPQACFDKSAISCIYTMLPFECFSAPLSHRRILGLLAWQFFPATRPWTSSPGCDIIISMRRADSSYQHCCSAACVWCTINRDNRSEAASCLTHHQLTFVVQT